MEQYHKALDHALRYLDRKLRTEKEIREKLYHYYPQATVDEVVEHLKAVGLVNDNNYIECFIRDRLKLNPWGKKKIQLELQKKGIESYLIDNNPLFKSLDEVSIIEELIEKKFKNCHLTDPTDRNKVISFFYRRGFSMENIFTALIKFTSNWRD